MCYPVLNTQTFNLLCFRKCKTRHLNLVAQNGNVIAELHVELLQLFFNLAQSLSFFMGTLCPAQFFNHYYNCSLIYQRIYLILLEVLYNQPCTSKTMSVKKRLLLRTSLTVQCFSYIVSVLIYSFELLVCTDPTTLYLINTSSFLIYRS